MANKTDREKRLHEKWKKKLPEYPYFLTCFYRCMQLENKSLLTIDTYMNNILHFAKYYCRNNQINCFFESVSPTDLEQYFTILEKTGNNSDILKLRWTSLNTFFNWCKKDDWIRTNPMDSINRPSKKTEHPVNCLDISVINTLLDIIDKNPDWGMSVRDKSLVSLALSTALRISTLLNLNLEDIDFENGVIRITDNHNIVRNIILEENTRDSLEYWIDVRADEYGDVGTTALFVSKKKNRLSVDAANDMLKNYCNAANIPKIVVSDLTETAICTLIKHHVPLKTIMEYCDFKDKNRLIAYVEKVFDNDEEKPESILDRLLSAENNDSILYYDWINDYDEWDDVD